MFHRPITAIAKSITTFRRCVLIISLMVLVICERCLVTPVRAQVAESAKDDSRAALPAAAEQAKMLGEIKSIFSAEYSKAKKPEDKGALSRTLLKQSESTQDDSGTSYVLLKESQRLALEGADVETALKTVELLAADYRVDEVAMLHDVLDELSKDVKTPLAIRAVNEATKSAIDKAVAEDKYAVATKLCVLGTSIARKAKDTAEGKRYVDTKNAIALQQKDFEAAEKAKAVLQKSPDDGPANYERGVFLVQRKQDWTQGLEHLAKSSDKELSRLAKLDLGNPEEPNAQLELADGWYAWTVPVKKTKPTWTKALARYWYSKALTDLAGVDKIKVEKRLQELGQLDLNRDEFGTTKAVVAKPTPTPMPNPVANPGQVPAAMQYQLPNKEQAKIHAAVAELASKTKGFHASYRWARGSSFISASLPIPTEPFIITGVNIVGDDVTEDEIKVVEGLVTLEQFFCIRSGFTGKYLGYLATCPNLTSLEVTSPGQENTATFAEGLMRLRRLQRINFLHSESTPREIIAAASGCPDLTSLSVAVGPEVTAADLRKFRKLTEISLRGSVTDEHLDGIKELTALQSLSISAGIFTDTGLSELKNLRSLRYLTLTNAPNVFGDGLSGLPRQSITNVTIDAVPLSNEALLAISRFPSLTYLSLGDCIPDGGTHAFLKNASQLTSLTLRKTKVDDASFLGAMQRLMNLNFHELELSERSIKQVAQAPVRSLYFQKVSVTDEHLKLFAGHRTLQMIGLFGTQVTPAGADALKLSSPKLIINKSR